MATIGMGVGAGMGTKHILFGQVTDSSWKEGVCGGGGGRGEGR